MVAAKHKGEKKLDAFLSVLLCRSPIRIGVSPWQPMLASNVSIYFENYQGETLILTGERSPK